MKDNAVLRVVAKIIVPVILVFSLYVQFHGDYGPGGGFQAGVIFAAAFICLLYTSPSPRDLSTSRMPSSA